jgi:ribonuclease P protein component
MRDAGARRTVGRLTKRPEYLAAASGRRFHTGRMTVQARLRDDADGLRFGITVTKRVGHATERNRIRRRLRAAIQAAAVEHLDRSADVVVIGRREALSAAFPVLLDDLGCALKVVTKPKPARPAAALLSGAGGRRGSSDA